MPARIKLARGRHRQQPGQMNKTESAYADELKARQMAGEIDWFGFEAWKLKLADNAFYTPDFVVMLSDLTLECHEVKGHWEEDARVKIKVAAETYPMLRFVAIKKQTKRQGGGWDYEIFR